MFGIGESNLQLFRLTHLFYSWVFEANVAQSLSFACLVLVPVVNLFYLVADIIAKHFRLAEILYYKVLESVIEQEKRRLGDADLSVSKLSGMLC